MPKSGARQLSAYQFTCILVGVLLGHQVITLPRTVAERAGEAGWLSVLLATGLALASIGLMHQVYRQQPGEPFPRVCQQALGWLRWPVCLGLALAWTVQAGLQVREYAALAQSAILTRTPQFAVSVLLLAPVVYLLRFQLRVLGRLLELYAVFAALALILAPLGAIGHFRSTFLLPLLGTGPAGIAAGAVAAFQQFLGLDVALVLWPYLLRPHTSLGAGVRGVMAAGAVHLYLTGMAVGVLGAQALLDFGWPVLEIIKVARVPGTLLERLEAPFISVGVTAIFSTAGVYLFAAAVLLRDLLRLGSHRYLGAVLVLLAGIVSVLPRNLEEIQWWIEQSGKVLWFTGWVLPLALALLLRWRRPPAAAGG